MTSIRSGLIASPVLILALDTTTRAGSAAVLRNDDVLAVSPGDSTRTHGERLPAEIEAVLQMAGVPLAEIELLAVASGPGAFTGLRIGLAAMQGLALASGCPVVGVSALDALGAEALDALGAEALARVDGERVRIGAWMDAARGEVFAAAYDATGRCETTVDLVRIAEPEVGAPDEVWTRWRASGEDGWVFIGDGAERYAANLSGQRIVSAPPLAPAVARLGRRAAASGTAPLTPHELQPLYVRRPDAERGGPAA